MRTPSARCFSFSVFQRVRLACAPFVAVLLLLVGTRPDAQAQAHFIESASPGLSEAGAPLFSVRSQETLGLNSPPTDLHLMPDGRVMVFANQQIVLGDGIRWETFRQAADDVHTPAAAVQVSPDGGIYVAVPGGFGQVEFGDDAQWRLKRAANQPDNDASLNPVLRFTVDAGGEWIWHSGSGAVVDWNPGRPAKEIGHADAIETIFRLHDSIFLTDRTTGALWRLRDGAMTAVPFTENISPSETLTCATPFTDELLLVGTYSHGLRLFDGRATRPFLEHGLLSSDLRINDLCVMDGDYFAAAIENLGIVFFDRSGRTLQTLDRTLDHRLAHVRRLVPAPGGMVWGLLSDGLLQVEFPSRVSYFESLIGTGVTTGHPYRFRGKLWMMADGNIQRGIYDTDGRLTGLQVDTPPGRFTFTFSCTMGVPVAGTERGAFFRNDTGWVPFAPWTHNLKVLKTSPVDGRWLYGATGEIGWLQLRDGVMQVERIPVPNLDNPYNSETDSEGTVWLELGNAQVGRIRFKETNPVVEIFGRESGLPQGWAQLFCLDGKAGLNIEDRLYRFDEGARRFVPDPTTLKEIRRDHAIFGRPILDVSGRLWTTINGAVQVFEKHDGLWTNAHEQIPPGLSPYYFTAETNGAVWMHGERRLARFDPTMPVVRPVPLHALITHVSLPLSGRALFSVGLDLVPLDYSDNSLVVHYVAPGHPFAAPVSFDVRLEGSGADWVSAGGGGSTAFNRLKEGRYILHVRPRSAGETGDETTLSFTIRPPWFRTNIAYLTYGLLAFGFIFVAGRVSSFLERRENSRLERLVAQRTRELNASNNQLAGQVEENRMLSQAVEQSPVAVFITTLDGAIAFANSRAYALTGLSPEEVIGQRLYRLQGAGMPAAMVEEITSTLARGGSWHGQLGHQHKDGHLVHVRTTISPMRGPDGKLRYYLVLKEDISASLAEQDRRRRLEAQLFQAQKLESIGTLAGGIAHDFNNILTAILGFCELARLEAAPGEAIQKDLDEIRTAGMRAKELVAQILTFSRQGTAKLVPLDLAQAVTDALRLVRASTPATVEFVTSLEGGTVRADSTQVQQIVLNLCTNSVHAMNGRSGRITLSVKSVRVSEALAAEIPDLTVGEFMLLAVSDNGTGMDQATLDRVFDPFFTTKKQGEGTGLGLAIVQGIVASHRGALRVKSTVGEGTTFEIYFPETRENCITLEPDQPAPRGNGEEILVVDDEPVVADFVASRLKQLGYRPLPFRDPLAALAAVSEAPTRFHAIITDLTMPQLTGADLVRKIRAFGLSMPAVVVTGYSPDATRTELSALSRCVVVQKPFSGDEVALALAQVLQTRAEESTGAVSRGS